MVVLTMIAVLTTGFGLVSCSDPDRSASRFCAELASALPLLTGPLVEPADVDDLVRRYERLDRITPLAVEDDWHLLTELVRTASDVDVNDPDSRQEVADLAYRSERAARDVAIWVETTCGLSMPDVIGVEGSVPVSLPPQTEPPPVDTIPPGTTPPGTMP